MFKPKPIVAAIALSLGNPAHAATGIWIPTNSMASVRYGHAAFLLGNGKVLVTGDSANNSPYELYDYLTGTWSPTGGSTCAYPQAAVLLATGKILMVNSNGTANLYDPTTYTCSPTGTTYWARGYSTLTRLNTGKVLAVGGNGVYAELYNPTTGVWSLTTAMAADHSAGTATLLDNGKVLVTGYVAGAELFAPSTGTWSNAGTMNLARYGHTATKLANGKVLITGGNDQQHSLFRSETYDPTTNTWSTVGSMTQSRQDYTATLLANGSVLVTGGCYLYSYNYYFVNSAEVYDPGTSSWNFIVPMTDYRSQHTATLLPNGRVLVAGGLGGTSNSSNNKLSNAGLYDFGTPLLAITQPATNLTQTSATLNGQVSDNGTATTITFDFGTTTNYGTNFAATPATLEPGDGTTAVSATRTGLTCTTVYHYRVKAANSAGTIHGADQSFTPNCPAPTPPAVSTDAPSVITPTSVKLTGTVNPNNATTTVSFDFGLTTLSTCGGGQGGGNCTSINATPNSIPGTATATVVSADKAGLNCNTEYFYRVKATNSAGTSLGTERSFTTSTCPPVNAWLYPVNPTIIVDHDFTLDLHVDSHGVKVGSYDFQINFDKERLVVDDTKCDNGVCPGTDAVDTSTVVTDNNTGVIKVAGFDMDGVGPNNDLQLLVIHFKTKITPGPTLIDLTTNELATVLGEVIGLGSRDNLVTISPGICGDADGNGAVNIVDALAIARRAVGLPPPPTVNTLWADVNQNQITNITDAMLIARHSVGMLVVGTCNIGQALPF